MKLKPFQAYTIDDDAHTYGYTIYWPVREEVKKVWGGRTGTMKSFYGWTFYPDDTGRIIDHKPLGNQFIEFEYEEDITKFYGYEPTKKMEDYVMYSMIREIFGERKK